MEFTEGQKAEFRNRFSIRRRRQLALSVPSILLIVGVLLAGGNRTFSVYGISSAVLAPILLCAILGMVGFSLVNWRCPACNRYLGKQMNPRYCSKCGIPLQ